MKIEDLNLSVRAFNAVCRAEIKTIPELYNMYQCDSEELRLLVGNKHFEEIGDALAKHREAVWEENRKADESAATPNPAVIVSEDYTRAVTLTRSIIANAQAAQQSLYEVCKGLKEMRDGKLYKELGYQNFEDYTENEVGIKKVQAYNFVAIASNLSADYVQSIEQIGTTKLALLAKLDEPTREAVTETVDVESVTVRELRDKVKELEKTKSTLIDDIKRTADERDAAKGSLASKDKQFQEALDAKDRQIKAAKESGEKSLSDCKAYLNGRIHELEDRIKEMENAPIDHEMTDADAAEEIKRLKRELEDEQLRYTVLEGSANARARKAADEVRHELSQVHEKELQTLREGYEKQLAEKSQEPDETELDEARFNSFRLMFEELVDELENLLETMHDDPRIGFINRLDNYWTDNLLYLKREGEGAGA